MKKLSYILLCGLMFILSACEKDTESTNFAPVVTTGTASNIYRMGATLSGSIQLTETNTAQSYGILLSSFESMAEATEYPVKDGSSNYNVLVQGLESGETYYYCAYASSGYSTAKSQIKSFTTTNSNPPVFNEVILQSKDEKSCTVSVEILDEGGSDLLISGFVLGESGKGDPTATNNIKIQNVEPQGSKISATLSGLEPNKTYLVRAYGINASGPGYSNSVSVTTNTATVPFLSDITRVDSTEVSVTVKSAVLDAGLGEVSKYGFCYSSESKNPTIDHLVVENVEGDSKNFSALIDGLKPETTYYIRAYAINEKGTGYSETFIYATPEPTLIEGNEGDVNVAEPGGLSKFIDDTNKYNITTLKVSGYLNGDDIRLIREMAGRDVNGNETPGRLVDLDISEATIVAGGGEYFISEWGETFKTSNDLVGGCMFYRTILNNISIPNGTIIICDRAFETCFDLVNVNIPSGVLEIGQSVFAGCGQLRNISIPETVTGIGSGAFADCYNLSVINIPSSVQYISWGLFSNCSSLTTVGLPYGITTIGWQAFYNCTALSDIAIPSSVTTIEYEAFWGCSSLTSINLPEGLTSIGTYAFCSCSSLSSVNIPNSITTLENGVFRACSSLTSILIPETVTAIGTQAFYECTSLVEVTCKATTPPEFPTGHPVFGTYELNCIPSSVLYVPTGCASAYKNSEWNGYFSIIKAEGETDSGEGSFDDMPNIEW